MLEKIVEGRNVSYVVRMSKQIDEYPLFIDATRAIEDAIRKDRNLRVWGHPDGYSPENGPQYAIERQRVEDYVKYAADYINRENYYKFDTKTYRFFLGSVPTQQRKAYNGNPD